MPRLPRIYLEKALYYVTAKGDIHQHIFKDEEDFKAFLELLRKYKEQYGFKLFAFCLVPEHFHLLLELPEQKEGKYKMGVLSGIMHDLNSSYTKYYNAKYARKGHLFRERYRAALAEKDAYLLRLSLYIHLNPQRLNLVSRPEEYPYSSYGLYLNKGGSYDTLIRNEKQEIFGLLAGKDYADFVSMTIREPDLLNLHDSLQEGILGSGDFQEKARQALSSYTKEKSSARSSHGKRGQLIFLIVLIGVLGLAYALRTGKQQGKSGAAVSFPLKFPAQVKELLRDMERTEWRIRVISLDKGDVQDDVISFKDGKFISRNFSARDYPASDYFLVIGDDDKITWESRQSGPDAAALWKGEIKKGEMEGGLLLRYPDSTTRELSFVSMGFKKNE